MAQRTKPHPPCLHIFNPALFGAFLYFFPPSVPHLVYDLFHYSHFGAFLASVLLHQRNLQVSPVCVKPTGSKKGSV